MDKVEFWRIIETANDICGVWNQKDYLQSIHESLKCLDAHEIQEFQYIFKAYVKLADKFGLWSAAMVINKRCSDDNFIDFRCWLIANGKEVYLNALKNPDSLAIFERKMYGNCTFESLMYVAPKKYECMTGHHPYENWDGDHFSKLLVDLGKDIVYDEGIEYPYRWNEVAVYVPELASRYMSPEDLGIKILNHNDPWADNDKISYARLNFRPLVREINSTEVQKK